MGTYARAENLVILMATGVVVTIVTLLGFAAASGPAAGIGLAVTLGFGVNSIGTGGQMMVQTTVRGDMRGRVLGIWGMSIRAGPAFGALALGSLTNILSFPAIFVLTAAICGLWGARTFRHRRAMTTGMQTLP
tara:strand:- start:263 stop:661 length:399 start_codon:yes stop_codon:yes gene_type:complete